MYKHYAIIISLLSTLSIISNAQSARFFGKVHLANQHYTDLEINGSAYLEDVTVANRAAIRGSAHCKDVTCLKLTVKGGLTGNAIIVKHADISGSVECRNSSFDTLNVCGSCTLNDNTIETKLCVDGSLNATDLECPFIEVKTRKLELKNARVTTVIVKKNENRYYGFFNLWGLLRLSTHKPEATKVYLDGGSIDSITFQELPGTVILIHSARVGTVYNGTIETL